MYHALQRLSDEEFLRLLLSPSPSIGGEPLPTLPPLELQMRTNAPTDVESNLRVALAFHRFVRKRVRLELQHRILDFGCGWGRVLRFFLRDVKPDTLFGIDVDPESVSLARKTCPSGNFKTVPARGPCPFEDLDLVYAVSVFSHLPEELHLCWLAELHRVLKPGATLIVTTLSPSTTVKKAAEIRTQGSCDAAWKRGLADSFPPESQAAADAGHYVYGPHPHPDYGMAIIPRGYVDRVWSNFFEVLDYVDDESVFGQAIIVAKKRPQRATSKR